MLFDYKLPKFLGTLIDTHPKVFKEYVEVIIRTAESNYIMKLIDKKVTDSETCLNILMNSCRSDNSKKISLILSQLKVNEKYLIENVSDSQWGLICLGALGYIGNLKTA